MIIDETQRVSDTRLYVQSRMLLSAFGIVTPLQSLTRTGLPVPEPPFWVG